MGPADPIRTVGPNATLIPSVTYDDNEELEDPEDQVTIFLKISISAEKFLDKHLLLTIY
jgi:hypothetical protein